MVYHVVNQSVPISSPAQPKQLSNPACDSSTTTPNLSSLDTTKPEEREGKMEGGEDGEREREERDQMYQKNI